MDYYEDNYDTDFSLISGSMKACGGSNSRKAGIGKGRQKKKTQKKQSEQAPSIYNAKFVRNKIDMINNTANKQKDKNSKRLNKKTLNKKTNKKKKY